MFGIRTVVFRHSSMCGGNQHATYDQGWVGWFIRKALEIKNGQALKPFTISGNGKQVRDILHASNVVELYFKAAEHIEQTKGEVFNIGGGMKNSLSLLELFGLLENILEIKMIYTQLPFCESDQLVFVANNTKIAELAGWHPTISTSEGLSKLLTRTK
jgi:CDP-paratose 2-epimerase